MEIDDHQEDNDFVTTDDDDEDDDVHSSLEALYQATPYTVMHPWEESPEMDRLLHALQSPAHQSWFVMRRMMIIVMTTKQKQEHWMEGCGDPNDHPDDSQNNPFSLRLQHLLWQYGRPLLKPGFEFLVRSSLSPRGTDDHCEEDCSNYDKNSKNKNNLRRFYYPGVWYNVIPKTKSEPEPLPTGWKKLSAAIKNNSSNNLAHTTDKSCRQLVADICAMAANDNGNNKNNQQQVGEKSNGTNKIRQDTSNNHKIRNRLQQLRRRLFLMLTTETRNAMAADMALSLSMAGLFDHNDQGHDFDKHDPKKEDSALPRVNAPAIARTTPTAIHVLLNDIVRILAHCYTLEVQRKRQHKSNNNRKGTTEVLMGFEKLAAAGALLEENQTVMTLLANSNDDDDSNLVPLSQWSPRALLWLWRKAHVLHKVSALDLETAWTSNNNGEEVRRPPFSFADNTKPLIVDVGCGLGVSLLGLAVAGRSRRRETSDIGQRDSPRTWPIPLPPPPGTTTAIEQNEWTLDWSQFNYLGGDISRQAVRWATSMAERRHLADSFQICHATSQALLDYLVHESTDNTVAMFLLQFPTPYRLQQPDVGRTEDSTMEAASRSHESGDQHDDDSNTKTKKDKNHKKKGCNEKLPSGPEDPEFMANPAMLQCMVDILHKGAARPPQCPTSEDISPPAEQTGYLLVQTNCEDVALYLYDTLLTMGLEPVPAAQPRLSMEDGVLERPSTRTETWLRLQQHGVGRDGPRRAVGQDWSAVPILPVGTETEASCDHIGTPVHRCLFVVPKQ